MLDEAGVSRAHARFFEENGRFFVEDLRSFNGTKVNGTKISQTTELHDGDTVAVGQVVIAFQGSVVAESADATMAMMDPPAHFAEPPPPEERTDEAAQPFRSGPKPGVRATGTRPFIARPSGERLALSPPRPSGQRKALDAEPPRPSGERKALDAAPVRSTGERKSLGKSSVLEALPPKLQAPSEDSPTSTGTGPALSAVPDDGATMLGAAPPAAAFVPPPEEGATMLGSAPSYEPPSVAASETVIRMAPERTAPPPVQHSETVIRELPVRPSGEKKALSPVRASGERQAIAPGLDQDETAPVRVARPKPPEAKPVSAVDRARRRREANESLGALLKFHWEELSLKGRIIAGSSAGVVGLGMLITLAVIFWPKSQVEGPKGDEPVQLGFKPITASFGYGDGVTWERRDLKAFDFFFQSPTRAVAVLHYQAKNITPDEVTITVNGVAEGSIEADSANADERELQQVLRARDLKRNEKNQIVFEHVKAAGDDSWKLWNLWIEVLPIPELPNDQLMQQAQADVTKGRQFFDQRDVGSSNLFRAWKAYRDAWLTMEALDSRPELYQQVRFQLNSIGRQLDQQCGLLMLAAKRAIELRHRKEAKQVLESVNDYFPTAEHRCHNLALEKLNQYDL